MERKKNIYYNFTRLRDSSTGESFSEALILASTNPKYDKRLFIELQVQYIKTTSSEHVVYIKCFELSIQNIFVRFLVQMKTLKSPL